MDRRNQFSRENGFLCLFSKIWIKIHFPFKSPFRYLLGIGGKIASWNSFVINSWENRCVICKEFYIWGNTLWKIINVNQKKKKPKIDPWGTPALILAHVDDCPLWRTVWYLSRKKLSIRLKRLPEIPTDSNIYNKLLSQTLSKAFEICKDTAIVLRVRLQSNVEKILWVISINW